MGLETGTYISDLVATNPVASDLRSVGDDHLRLLKSVLKSTLPNGDRAQYFKRVAAKTANYVVLATDMEKSFTGDATAGAFSFTLPTLVSGNDGWACEVIKIDSSANAITIVGTINGETNIVLKKQYETLRLLWTGSAWLAFHPIVFRDGTLVLPIGTTGTRPVTPQKGALWYNDTTGNLEYSDNTNWFALLTTLQGAQLAYGGILNGTIVESHVGNAVTFALKTLAGADPTPADPVLVAFRSPTSTSGVYVFRQVTTATSITLSSGSKVGTVDNIAFNLWGVLFDDAGTIRIGVINCLSSLSIYPLGQFPIASSIAEGGAGAADAAQTFYTGTAVASKAYIPLFYAYYGPTIIPTAGNWAAAPTRIQLFGCGIPLPGTLIQLQRTATSASSTGTTIIPADDTIPQNTEGDQYMSQAIIPSSAANLLRVRTETFFSCNTGLFALANALFQDAVANALATKSTLCSSGNQTVTCSLDFLVLAGLTISTTFKLRIGPSSASTVTFNGSAAIPGRMYGGTANSYIEAQELAT